MGTTGEYAKSLIGKSFKSRMENINGTGEILYIKIIEVHSPKTEDHLDYAHLQVTHFIIKVPLKDENLYQTFSIDKKNFSRDLYSDIILYSEEDFQKTFSECSEEEWTGVESLHQEMIALSKTKLGKFINFSNIPSELNFERTYEIVV